MDKLNRPFGIFSSFCRPKHPTGGYPVPFLGFLHFRRILHPGQLFNRAFGRLVNLCG
jgi:hypothetical protein